MSVVAHFVGGPLDGTMLEIEESLPVIRVPVAPPEPWFVDMPGAKDAPLKLPQPLEYVRRPGIVASEAVYELRR